MSDLQNPSRRRSGIDAAPLPQSVLPLESVGRKCAGGQSRQ